MAEKFNITFHSNNIQLYSGNTLLQIRVYMHTVLAIYSLLLTSFRVCVFVCVRVLINARSVCSRLLLTHNHNIILQRIESIRWLHISVYTQVYICTLIYVHVHVLDIDGYDFIRWRNVTSVQMYNIHSSEGIPYNISYFAHAHLPSYVFVWCDSHVCLHMTYFCLSLSV